MKFRYVVRGHVPFSALRAGTAGKTPDYQLPLDTGVQNLASGL